MMYLYKCPTCGNTIEVARREEAPCRPFCCERCQQVDLGKWLTEHYRVSEPADPNQEDQLNDGGSTSGDG